MKIGYNYISLSMQPPLVKFWRYSIDLETTSSSYSFAIVLVGFGVFLLFQMIVKPFTFWFLIVSLPTKVRISWFVIYVQRMICQEIACSGFLDQEEAHTAVWNQSFGQSENWTEYIRCDGLIIYLTESC